MAAVAINGLITVSLRGAWQNLNNYIGVILVCKLLVKWVFGGMRLVYHNA